MSKFSGVKEVTAPSGIRVSITYIDGQWNGPYTECYPDGQIKRKAYHKDGYLYGLFQEWHPNGQLYHEVTYDTEYYMHYDWTGENKVWCPNGHLYSHRLWSHGTQLIDYLNRPDIYRCRCSFPHFLTYEDTLKEISHLIHR